MKSRKMKLLQQLSPSALCFVLSGCLFGENKTFFDYEKSQVNMEMGSSTPSLTVSNSFTQTETLTGTDTEVQTGTEVTDVTVTDTDTDTQTNVQVGTQTDTDSNTVTSTNTNTATLSLCCNIQSGHVVPASEMGCQQGVALTPVSSVQECESLVVVPTAIAREVFPAVSNQVKKVDFLFVVDNSGSMADNQAKLAQGFESFANTFYRREDLDICTAIITSDRYLGSTNYLGYSRERILPCTKPAGWAQLNAAQRESHIQALIREFKAQVNVGTRGSGTELPGKSLVSFLYSLPQWSSNHSTATRTSFFRADAVANISFVTDENNWFYRNENPNENRNDLPAIQNAPVYNSTSGAVDARKGIVNHLNDFFAALNPGKAPTFSVTTFLEVNKSPHTLPGIAMNLAMVHELVKRESAAADIGASAASFAQTYQGVGQGIVIRASALTLAHSIYEPLYPAQIQALKVNVVQPGSQPVLLNIGSGFTLLMPNGIVLDESVRNQLGQDDLIEVEYQHELRN